MDEGILRRGGAKVCRKEPTKMFWELVEFWRNIYNEEV